MKKKTLYFFIFTLFNIFSFLSLPLKAQSQENKSIIKNIKFTIHGSNLKSQLLSNSSHFIGSIDSEKIRNSLAHSIETILKNNAYLNPTIILSTEEKQGLIYYNFKIKRGPPCLIKNITLAFQKIDSINFPIKKNDLCDLKKINYQISHYQESLKKNGYYNAAISLERIDYNHQESHGHVHISGLVGDKMSFKIVESQRTGLLTFLIGEKNPIASYNFSYFNEESLRLHILNFYKDHGYYEAVVNKAQKEPTSQTVKAYTFIVIPGKKYIIKKIQILGNKIFNKSEILKNTLSAQTLSEGSYYDQEKMESLLEAFENFYQEQGFWSASAYLSSIRKKEALGLLELSIKINEGKQVILNSFAVKGHSFFTKEQLKSFYWLKEGEKLSKSQISDLESEFLERYFAQGFLKTTFTFEIEKEKEKESSNKVDFLKLTLNIKEGKRTKIKKISFTQTLDTKISLIKSLLEVKEGQWFDPKKINQSRENLLKLGIFRSIEFQRIVINDKLRQQQDIELHIKIQENDAGFLSFGPGYDLRKGYLYKADLSYNNLFGLAHKIQLRTSLSEEKSQKSIASLEENTAKTFLGRQISLSYLNPYIWNLPLSSSVLLKHKGTAESFWQLSDSFELALKYNMWHLLRKSDITLYYQLQSHEDVGSNIQKEILATTGLNEIGSLGLRLNMDLRNNISWPKNGFITEIDLSYAHPILSGQYSYCKWSLTHAYYLNIFKDLVFAQSMSYTAYENVKKKGSTLDSSVLPSSERLLAGGQNKVRGFAKQLGPYILIKDDNQYIKEDPFGATRRFILKSELRIRHSSNWASSIFFDLGNTFFSEQELFKFKSRFEEIEKKDRKKVSLEDNFNYSFTDILNKPSLLFSKNYQSVGIGASFLSPIGSINLAAAYPLNEPQNTQCQKDPRSCLKRANSGTSIWQKLKFELNVGTNF